VFVVEKGEGFLGVLRFSLPFIPPVSSLGAGIIGLLVAAVPSGPNWTPPPTIPIKRKLKFSMSKLNRICVSI
jgi:hypothetical protein